jgi:NAD(P)-dependent dehydrogenase (short-subunit alcohol dehydrogenase family)
MGGRLAGKRIFVGGGGSVGERAIGRCCCELYAREGAAVFVADRNPEAALATVSAITGAGGRAFAGIGDLSSPADVERLAGEAYARLGRIDGLHNNVGVTRTGAPAELPLDDWEASWRDNVTSVFLALRLIVPRMAADGGGSVVSTSSVAASRYLGAPYHAYYASKAAVSQLTRTMAAQFARDGLRFNVVSPGFIDTLNTAVFKAGADGPTSAVLAGRASQNPAGRLGTPLDVAYAALFLLSDESGYVNGAEILVDGGLSAVAVNHPAPPRADGQAGGAGEPPASPRDAGT